jgi:predicted methyltransferase
MKTLFTIAFTFFFACVAAVQAQTSVEQLLNSPNRSAEDKKSDLTRKPAKFIQFLDIQPAMQVLDVFSGTGYYTEIVAGVVGPTGHVDAHNNQAYVNYIGAEKLAKRYQNNRLPNVNQITQEANTLSLKDNYYDRVLLVLSFHDLFYVDEKNGWPAIDATTFMKVIGQTLNQNGVVGIIDHAAAPGTDISSAQTAHRIDPAIIVKKMQEWGFTLIGEEDYLRNNLDPLTVPMWDESISGKTDRIVMKFAYPK